MYVGGPPCTDGVAGLGMTVAVRFVGDDEEVTFLPALGEESGSRTPISGKRVGETATYALPNGGTSAVEMLEAVPYAGS